MNSVIPRDVTANQGRNRGTLHWCILCRIRVSIQTMQFNISSKGQRRKEADSDRDNDQGKKGYLLLNNANLHG